MSLADRGQVWVCSATICIARTACGFLIGDPSMVYPSQLPKRVLADVVDQIQQLLWLERGDSGERWNGDKEWDSETVEHVAGVLNEHGLRPDDTVVKPT